MVEGFDLEALVDKYHGDANKGARGGYLQISKNWVYRFPDEWARAVVTGIYPNFYNRNAYNRKQEAVRIGEFLLDAKNAGFEDEYIKPINKVHVANIRNSYRSLERLIDPTVQRLHVEPELVEEVLEMDPIKKYIFTIPTAFRQMRFVEQGDTSYFMRQFQDILREKGVVDIIEKEQLLKKAWGDLRGNAKPARLEYEEPLVEPVSILPEAPKLELYTEDDILKQNEMMKPYTEQLLEIVGRVIWVYPPLIPIKGTLNWDRPSINDGFEGAVSNINILPGDIESLNPVDLTALIIYTLHQRFEYREISQTAYLKTLGDALEIYKTLSTKSKIPIPQGEGPLNFFREVYPTILGNNGYFATDAIFQELAREAVLDDEISVSPTEIAKIFVNIATKIKIESKDDDPQKYVIRFKTFEGGNDFTYIGDDQRREQVKEVVWQTIPSLIQAKGYLSLDAVINSGIDRSKRPAVYEAIKREQGNLEYAETFENTTEGTLVYVAPEKVGLFVEYLEGLVIEHINSAKRERRQQNRDQNKQNQAIRYLPQPESVPTSDDYSKPTETPVVVGSQNNEVGGENSATYGRPLFEELSRTYYSALLLKIKKRSDPQLWNTFNRATERLVTFFQRNPELKDGYGEKLETMADDGDV